ncbi:hypothetical protein ACX27_27315 [Nostoc piscinale CENA21]|uniref:Uncharacterized protein n=1 Tax=Nostoc piscinale CENA21 TaxID=224013 RepID=A0A0M4T0V5_9NOSO|nr:hypothetical protein [Nostoc piscinale]ALF55721.1 hypothetical protein ACX27_27315 [Nostoc piscinale CENA21]
MSIQQVLNEIAIAHLNRKTQEELKRLQAIASAASVVAQDERVKDLRGGRDLVAVLNLQSN